MIARLAHNPRVIVAPGHAALAAEIARLVGGGPPVGDWFIKLEALGAGVAAEVSRLAMRHGGGALVHETGDGLAEAILRIPGDCLEVYLAALGGDLADAIRATAAAWRRTAFVLRCGGRTLEVGPRTLVVGIVNVTPDSFSDGGRFLDPAKAIAHGRRLAEEGADILDVGGESTRPGAEAVGAEAECGRVLPVVEALAREAAVPISIDTSKAAVARRALDAGAAILNDVTALHGDPEMAAVAAESGAPLVLMHMQGTPRSMQVDPHYDDLMSEVVAYLRASMAAAADAGVAEEQIIVDPGIGFGKTVEHNLEILRRLGELRSLGRPILVGTSRKSVVGKVLEEGRRGLPRRFATKLRPGGHSPSFGVPMGKRAFGTAATVAFAIAQGAHIVRVHDVAEMRQVAQMTDAMLGGGADGECHVTRDT